MDASLPAVIHDASESTANDTALPEKSNEQVVQVVLVILIWIMVNMMKQIFYYFTILRKKRSI